MDFVVVLISLILCQSVESYFGILSLKLSSLPMISWWLQDLEGSNGRDHVGGAGIWCLEGLGYWRCQWFQIGQESVLWKSSFIIKVEKNVKNACSSSPTSCIFEDTFFSLLFWQFWQKYIYQWPIIPPTCVSPCCPQILAAADAKYLVNLLS